MCVKLKSNLFVVLLFSICKQTFTAAPEFTQTGLDPVVYLYEYTNTITNVANLECADTDTPPDDVIVSLDSVTPATAACSTCFQVYPGCGTGAGANNFCVQFLPKGSFDYQRTKEYELKFSCRDVNNEEADPGYTVYLRLVPNTPPFFSTPGAVTTTVSNAENIKAGGSVYQVGCTDPNTDTLQYTLNTDPVTVNLFDIDSDGVIRAERDLNTFCRSSVTFRVTCQDPYNPAVGPISIQTTLNGANQQPVITGINFNRDVPEDTAVGTTLATFTVTDDDSPLNCQLFSSPVESQQYFDLDSAQRSIVVKTKLDYEQSTTRNTNVTVTCSDGFCTSNAAYYYVRVTDVNEPIELYPRDFTLSAEEGNIDIDPNWTPIDEDLNDEPTYTIVGGNSNGRFAVNPTTGRIASTLAYDVDLGAMPSTETLVIQAKDEGDHTSTTTVTLTITDINDNRPTFDPAASLTFTVSDCTTLLGTSLGTVVATDSDSAYRGNNVIRYSGGNGPISVLPNGDVRFSAAPTGGETYTVQVTATDAGEVPGPLTSADPAVVTVTVTPCPTTTTPAVTNTTTAAAATTTGTGSDTGSGSYTGPGAIDTSESSATNGLTENLGWIIAAALLGTAFLAGLAYMVYRFCYMGGGCRSLFSNDVIVEEVYETRTPPPQREVRRVKEAREGYRGSPTEQGNGRVWQERYPDDDYMGRDPLGARVPTPVNYGYPPNATNPPYNGPWRGRPALAY